jgi:CO/xanthine dehydrogenase Mo-binding subunit
MAQVVAEEFGLPSKTSTFTPAIPKSVGYSDAAAGSRIARTSTAALVEAGRDALNQLRVRAAEKLQCAPEQLDYTEGRFRLPGGAAITLGGSLMKAATLTDGAVVGRGVSTKLRAGRRDRGARVRRRGRYRHWAGDGAEVYGVQDVGLALNPTCPSRAKWPAASCRV